MKLTTFAFGKGFKSVGKIKLEATAKQEVPPGYEWNPENVRQKQPAKPPEPVVKQKKTFDKKKRHSGKDTHQRVMGRWKTPTYKP